MHNSPFTISHSSRFFRFCGLAQWTAKWKQKKVKRGKVIRKIFSFLYCCTIWLYFRLRNVFASSITNSRQQKRISRYTITFCSAFRMPLSDRYLCNFRNRPPHIHNLKPIIIFTLLTYRKPQPGAAFMHNISSARTFSSFHPVFEILQHHKFNEKFSAKTCWNLIICNVLGCNKLTSVRYVQRVMMQFMLWTSGKDEKQAKSL